MKWKTFKATIR